MGYYGASRAEWASVERALGLGVVQVANLAEEFQELPQCSAME